jgi:excisionase family DNA binding protein
MQNTLDPIAIPKSEDEQVAELRRLITLGGTADSGGKLRNIQLPDAFFQLLVRIVEERAEATASPELTTQEGADFLGMSRQFFVRLLDDGKIPFHRVGSHRRVYLRDLIEFRTDRDRRRHAAIEQMARDAVAAGVYDGDPQERARVPQRRPVSGSCQP